MQLKARTHPWAVAIRMLMAEAVGNATQTKEMPRHTLSEVEVLRAWSLLAAFLQ